ncbi:DUF2510 domain-containing protein [Mycobacterium sp. 852013-51886_SCH5428379]|uniref:DUF2510 domain-containing protein n=1 Tax=Mycobacterium sp. 852013-51886_SCH5428379 TaxID=1834111 RepID=UPI0018D45C91|nr:DUF2510 domain-containing protein [Mycobacterium sp. 852013-51886_SCH5428379]
MPQDYTGKGTEVTRDFELIPEPDNRHDPWAISVRADGRTVGYLPREHCRTLATVVRRVVASGFTPIVPGRIYAYDASDWENWDGYGDPPRDFAAKVQLKLGEPHALLPINDPPPVPHTLLPRSAIVQVTKEDQHTAALLKHVPPSGYGLLFVTLHEDATGAKTLVEVRIDGERVGQLTPQMSQRFLPLLRHLESRGLVTACWGDITGSAVAAEVRIDAVKANEADKAVLDGPPVTVPRLVACQSDPTGYDLSGVTAEVQPAAQYSDTGGRHRRLVAPAPLPPAGWYEDARVPSLIRYWNGDAWTDHVAPKAR